MNTMKALYKNIVSINYKSAIKRLYQASRLAISGKELDFTNGSISKAVFLLSLPMVLEMLMESIFAVVDIYFVSKLGTNAVAMVGLTESIITLIYSVAMGLSAATTAIVARRIGEKDADGAGITAFQAILTGFSISLVLSLAGLIFARPIMRLMGADEAMIHDFGGYAVIMLGSNTVIMLLFVINAVFRSAGDAIIAMKVLFVGNLLNIILDPVLIFGLGPIPAMGIEGAAIATVLGRGIAIVYQLFILLRGSGRVKIVLKHCHLRFDIIGSLLKLSVGGTVQTLVATTSWIVLMRVVSMFGSSALAGYTIALRIIVFVLLPSFGISNAAATLVGQNLGAKQPQRAEKSVWITGNLNLAFLALAGSVLVLFPGYFISFFINDADVIASGSQALRIVSYGFLAYGYGMVLVNSFNGAGDTFTPTKINVISYYLLEIPLAYFLAIYLGMNEQGVFWAIVCSESVMTLLAFYFFRQGKWKLMKV